MQKKIVCVCVCVRARVRERGGGRATVKFTDPFYRSLLFIENVYE